VSVIRKVYGGGVEVDCRDLVRHVTFQLPKQDPLSKDGCQWGSVAVGVAGLEASGISVCNERLFASLDKARSLTKHMKMFGPKRRRWGLNASPYEVKEVVEAVEVGYVGGQCYDAAVLSYRCSLITAGLQAVLDEMGMPAQVIVQAFDMVFGNSFRLEESGFKLKLRVDDKHRLRAVKAFRDVFGLADGATSELRLVGLNPMPLYGTAASRMKWKTLPTQEQLRPVRSFTLLARSPLSTVRGLLEVAMSECCASAMDGAVENMLVEEWQGKPKVRIDFNDNVVGFRMTDRFQRTFLPPRLLGGSGYGAFFIDWAIAARAWRQLGRVPQGGFFPMVADAVKGTRCTRYVRGEPTSWDNNVNGGAAGGRGVGRMAEASWSSGSSLTTSVEESFSGLVETVRRVRDEQSYVSMELENENRAAVEAAELRAAENAEAARAFTMEFEAQADRTREIRGALVADEVGGHLARSLSSVESTQRAIGSVVEEQARVQRAEMDALRADMERKIAALEAAVTVDREMQANAFGTVLLSIQKISTENREMFATFRLALESAGSLARPPTEEVRALGDGRTGVVREDVDAVGHVGMELGQGGGGSTPSPGRWGSRNSWGEGCCA
jgi:hypothetical protein